MATAALYGDHEVQQEAMPTQLLVLKRASEGEGASHTSAPNLGPVRAF